jgi:SAM-dependent methyltransferase
LFSHLPQNSKSNEYLEIGPFLNPTFTTGDGRIKTVDYFSTQELQNQAKKLGRNPQEVLNVDFICRNEKYNEIIHEKFDAIVACHVVEHVIEFIKYFKNMENLLNDDGILFIVLPDKRYSFDKFRQNTDISHLIYEFLAPNIDAEKRLHALETEIYYDKTYINGKNISEERLNIENLKWAIDSWQPGCHAHVFEFEYSLKKVFLPLCSMGLINFQLIEARMCSQFGEFALVFQLNREMKTWHEDQDFYS